MIIASTEYWGEANGEACIVFAADVYAPTLQDVPQTDWLCMTAVTHLGNRREVYHYGEDSFQALQIAVGFVVSEVRVFLNQHSGPLGLSADEIEADGSELSRILSLAMVRFDPRASMGQSEAP